MLSSLVEAFKVKELRNKILFTLGILALYRLGAFVPVPGIPFREFAGRRYTHAAVGVGLGDNDRGAVDGVSHILARRRVLDIDRELGAGNIGGSADSVFLVDPELGLRLIVNGV